VLKLDILQVALRHLQMSTEHNCSADGKGFMAVIPGTSYNVSEDPAEAEAISAELARAYEETIRIPNILMRRIFARPLGIIYIHGM